MWQVRQLTVRGIDKRLHASLKREAEQHGMSVNRYVVQVLSKAMGLGANQVLLQEYHDLDYLAEAWS